VVAEDNYNFVKIIIACTHCSEEAIIWIGNNWSDQRKMSWMAFGSLCRDSIREIVDDESNNSFTWSLLQPSSKTQGLEFCPPIFRFSYSNFAEEEET